MIFNTNYVYQCIYLNRLEFYRYDFVLLIFKKKKKDSSIVHIKVTLLYKLKRIKLLVYKNIKL